MWKNLVKYTKSLFYIDYGTLDEESRRIVYQQFCEECINRVNVISAIVFFGEIILTLLDFLSGFFAKHPLNKLNLFAELLIILSSLIVNFLCNKMVRKDYENTEARAQLMDIYKAVLFIGVCCFILSDIIVRQRTLGSFIVFLFIFQVVPFFNEGVNQAMYGAIGILISVVYLGAVPNATPGSLFSMLSILFAFAFSTESFRSFSIKKLISNRKNELMTERFSRLASQTITALSNAVEAKDLYTKGHSQRVAQYSREIARRLGYSDQELDDIYYIGLLHDIGKIGVSDAVINKTGRLTDEEFAAIKQHPSIGYDILKTITEIPGISIGAKMHHEKYNGTGYPDRIEGKDTPEIARIIAVADAYDAMTSSRSYRDVMPQEKVRSEIERNKGTQFSPEIADIMLAMIDEDKDYTMQAGAKKDVG